MILEKSIKLTVIKLDEIARNSYKASDDLIWRSMSDSYIKENLASVR